jgi:hypothetical protein
MRGDEHAWTRFDAQVLGVDMAYELYAWCQWLASAKRFDTGRTVVPRVQTRNCCAWDYMASRSS